MNIITKVTTALGSIGRHPVNHDRKWRAVLEYGFIQVAALVVQRDVCVKFPNDTRLLISPRMKGAAHFITPGLCEFEDMSFVMHFLRPDEMFADVGANVGAFTVLAAGVAGARAVSFEPSPDTYAMLRRNVGVNHLDERVRAVNAAVGGKSGTVQFSIGLGTENHVAAASEKDGSASIRMTTLDLELAGTPPFC